MLGQRRRRWASIKPALGQLNVFNISLFTTPQYRDATAAGMLQLWDYFKHKRYPDVGPALFRRWVDAPFFLGSGDYNVVCIYV